MIQKYIEKWKNLNIKDRIIYRNIAGAFVVKGGALVVSLMTMPVYMEYFSNQEVLGVWFTILSVLTWILNFDLGIGNGLRNKLSASLVKENYDESKEYISSAYGLTGVLVLLVTVR